MAQLLNGDRQLVSHLLEIFWFFIFQFILRLDPLSECFRVERWLTRLNLTTVIVNW